MKNNNNNNKFMDLYNRLEYTLNNLLNPNYAKHGVVAILERIVPKDMSINVKVIRETRNALTHMPHIDGVKTMIIHPKTIIYLEELLGFIQSNTLNVKKLY